MIQPPVAVSLVTVDEDVVKPPSTAQVTSEAGLLAAVIHVNVNASPDLAFSGASIVNFDGASVKRSYIQHRIRLNTHHGCIAKS